MYIDASLGKTAVLMKVYVNFILSFLIENRICHYIFLYKSV